MQLHVPQSCGPGRMLQQKEVSSGSLSHPNSQQVTCHLCPPSAQETSQSLLLAPHIFARGCGIKTLVLFLFVSDEAKEAWQCSLLLTEQAAALQGPRSLRLRC